MANSGFRDARQKLVEASNKYLGRNHNTTIIEDVEVFTKIRKGATESIVNKYCLSDTAKEVANNDE